jgi:hypothetical protein
VVAIVVVLLVVVGAVVGGVLATGGDDDGGGSAATTRETTRRTLDTRSTTTEEPVTTETFDTTATSTGETLDGTQVSVFDLVTGLCFDDPSGGNGTISVVYRRECTQPHDGEVFDFYDFPNPVGDPFPGDSVVSDTSNTECRNRFEAVTGTSFDSAPYKLFWLSPNAESWSNGDREVACYVRDINSDSGGKLQAPIVP